MESSTKGIDYGKALTWFAKDPKLANTLLTLSLYLLSCVLILPIFYVAPYFTGYILKMVQNIQQGIFELPTLEGSYWRDGITLIMVSMGISFVLGIMVAIVIFGGTIAGSILSESSTAGGTIVTIMFQLISLVIQVVGSIILPIVYFMAYAIYSKTGSISSILAIGNYKIVWQQNQWEIVISYVIYMAVVSALSTLGFMACCIGILPAAVASNFIMAGFIGQFKVEDVI